MAVDCLILAELAGALRRGAARSTLRPLRRGAHSPSQALLPKHRGQNSGGDCLNLGVDCLNLDVDCLNLVVDCFTCADRCTAPWSCSQPHGQNRGVDCLTWPESGRSLS